MKKIYSIVGLSLTALMGVGATGIFTQDKREIVQSVENSLTGEEAITALRQSYEAGNYENLLVDFEADYKTLVEDGSFDEFVKMREPLPEDEKLDAIAKEWEAQYRDLIVERNAKLVTACNGQGDELVCKRVASLLTELPDDQKQALNYLSSLRLKSPEMAANADEQKLIEIDLASEFKMIHLDAEHAAKPVENRAEKQIVLRMDMMKQMVEASKSFENKSLKETVSLASQSLDAMQARIWDLNLLNATMKKPSSDVEKAVASILGEHKERSQDLYQKEFLTKMN